MTEYCNQCAKVINDPDNRYQETVYGEGCNEVLCEACVVTCDQCDGLLAENDACYKHPEDDSGLLCLSCYENYLEKQYDYLMDQRCGAYAAKWGHND
ncbi:MAG TPA: hypothetical protein VLB82_06615 [Thermodesulfobacteriota bacterium]|nr:hypothetical protein [Thermodesulfobacteriota bacterium]